MKKSPKTLSVVYRVLAFIAVLSISGCLVDEDSTPTLKNRTTDDIRLLQNGDYFNYIVAGRFTPLGGGSPTLLEGTLNVTYTVESFPLPFTSEAGAPIPGGTIFREYSVLDLGPGNIYRVKRYIQQAPSGALSIVAARADITNNSPTGTRYRVGQYDAVFNPNPLSNPQPVEILASPVPSTNADNETNFRYQYMSGCETPAVDCNPILAQEINLISIEYQGNADVTTYDGRFNTLVVHYNGNFLGPSSPSPLLFNIMGACDSYQGSFTQSNYIFPEVGVVFIDTTCTPSGGGGYFYTASLSNTSVPIP